MIQVTNTLTRKKEPFVPQEPGKVRMYVCGPTVYNFIHIGNARPFVFFDVVRRFLEYSGLQVTHVMNFTDVDDRIIERARKEGCDSREIAERYIREFDVDIAALGLLKPHVSPRVLEHIPQIVTFIEGLVKNGSAYVTSDGEVLFSVRKFKPYGKLSGKNPDDMRAGARVEVGEHKKDPLDFSLWKPRKSEDEPAWDSPWGKGRPGWHIECSAMSRQYLGDSFDLHGGGMDLIHPHHENEIAQSEALTGKPFVRVWMHNNMLTLDKEKMSKSIGNIFLTRDFLSKYGAETLKYLLLSGHYRSTIDFSPRHIKDCQASLHRIYSTLKKAGQLAQLPKGQANSNPEEKNLETMGSEFPAKWREAMEDDFNTPKLLSLVFEYVRALNGYFDRKGFKPGPASGEIARKFVQEMGEISKIVNIFHERPAEFLEKLKRLVLVERGLSVTDIESEIAARSEARTRKDFAASDAARDSLLQKGIELRDTPQGTEWDIVFNQG